jgi:hypothetical protein
MYEGGHQIARMYGAIPTLLTTIPAAVLASRAESAIVAPVASAAASVATTVSPAPDKKQEERILP